MTLWSVLQAAPVALLLPLALTLALPLLVSGIILTLRHGRPAGLALRVALRAAIFLAAGFGIISAVASFAVLRGGLAYVASRFETNAAAMATDLADGVRTDSVARAIPPRLALRLLDAPDVAWVAYVPASGDALVAGARAPQLTPAGIGALVRSAGPRETAVPMRHGGGVDAVLLAAVRDGDGRPIGTAAYAVSAGAVVASATQLAWALLATALVLLVVSILATRRLLDLSVGERVRQLVLLLRGETLPQSLPGMAVPLDELQALAREVDGTVARSVALERERDAQYQVVLDQSPDAVFLHRDGQIRYANAAALALVGATQQRALAGIPFGTLVHPAPLAEPIAPSARKLRRLDASEIIVDCAVAEVAFGGDLLQQVILRDISARVRAEQALTRSEAVYRSLFDSAPIGIAVVDDEFVMHAVNPRMVALLQARSRADLLGRTPCDVVPFGAPDVARALQLLRAGQAHESMEVSYAVGDGELRHVVITVQPLPPEGGAPRWEMLWLDVSAQRALTQQVQHAQKLDALGRLSGGIAHDFNNLLTIIRANTSLLAALQGTSPEAEAIEDACVRGAALVRKLLVFGRTDHLAPELLSIGTLLHEVLQMMRRLLPETIAVLPPIAVPDVRVHVDRTAFEQVLLNVATNARDAMPDGGRLTLCATCEDLSPGSARLRGLAHGGQYLRLVVQDTGTGMPEAVRRRAFEPFFTTKTREKGSGLGLAIAYGIVTQLGGTITLDSREGEGTAVNIFFPVVHGGVPGTPALVPEPPVGATQGHGELVLLVEDDPAVLAGTQRALESLGYLVRTAAHGGEALDLLQQGHTPAVIVSDVTMPVLGGVAMLQAIRQRGLPLPVVLVSGYTTENLLDLAAGDPNVSVLAKPWSVEALARTVRAAMHRTDATHTGR